MRILAWSLEEILAEVRNYENQQKEIKHELLKICWYMRGGVSYDEAHFLSYEDREIISSIIKENLNTTKESGLPFF
jgi:hypothetical protein